MKVSTGQVLPLTPPKKPKLSAEKISRDFGAGIVASFIPISTQWMSVFGSCWDLRPVTHHTQLWSH